MIIDIETCGKKYKKIKGRNAVSANIVDNKSGEEGIAEVFSINYNNV